MFVNPKCPITVEQMKADYNWQEAFKNAGGDVNEVEEIYAAVEGCNDGPPWVALVGLKVGSKGEFAKMFAGCDYTGWDCIGNYGNIEYYNIDPDQLFSKTTLLLDEAIRLKDQILEVVGKEIHGVVVELDWEGEGDWKLNGQKP